MIFIFLKNFIKKKLFSISEIIDYNYHINPEKLKEKCFAN